jgi:hypothetical protein
MDQSIDMSTVISATCLCRSSSLCDRNKLTDKCVKVIRWQHCIRLVDPNEPVDQSVWALWRLWPEHYLSCLVEMVARICACRRIDCWWETIVLQYSSYDWITAQWFIQQTIQRQTASARTASGLTAYNCGAAKRERCLKNLSRMYCLLIRRMKALSVHVLNAVLPLNYNKEHVW